MLWRRRCRRCPQCSNISSETPCIIFTTLLYLLGTVAVVSLLTGSVVARFYGDVNGGQLLGNSTTGNETTGVGDMDASASLPDDIKIGIVMSLALLVGIAQVSHY